MSDPVNTDALRAIAAGFDAKGWVNNAQHCRAAADEVDRLRAELDAWEPAWRNMRDERDRALGVIDTLNTTYDVGRMLQAIRKVDAL